MSRLSKRITRKPVRQQVDEVERPRDELPAEPHHEQQQRLARRRARRTRSSARWRCVAAAMAGTLWCRRVASNAVRAAATPSPSGLGCGPRQHPLELVAGRARRRHSSTAASSRSASGPYVGDDGSSATAPSSGWRCGGGRSRASSVTSVRTVVTRCAGSPPPEVVEQRDEAGRGLVERTAARPQRRRRQRATPRSRSGCRPPGPSPRHGRGG